MGRLDAPESACERRLDGARREMRCDIPVARRPETGALLLATLMDVETKLSHLLFCFNLDLGSLNLGSQRRLNILFLDHFPFLRLAGELGVLLWFTYEMGNGYTYKY